MHPEVFSWLSGGELTTEFLSCLISSLYNLKILPFALESFTSTKPMKYVCSLTESWILIKGPLVRKRIQAEPDWIKTPTKPSSLVQRLVVLFRFALIGKTIVGVDRFVWLGSIVLGPNSFHLKSGNTGPSKPISSWGCSTPIFSLCWYMSAHGSDLKNWPTDPSSQNSAVLFSNHASN